MSNNTTVVSLELINRLIPSSILWLVAETTNLVLSSLCFFVFHKSPVFGSSATYTLLRWLLVNDICCSVSVYLILYQFWHVRNYLLSIPEVLLVGDCYKIICVQWFFGFNNFSLNLFIGIQRLCSILRQNSEFCRSYRFGLSLCLCSVLIGLFVNGSMCFCTFLLFIKDFRKQLIVKLGLSKISAAHITPAQPVLPPVVPN